LSLLLSKHWHSWLSVSRLLHRLLAIEIGYGRLLIKNLWLTLPEGRGNELRSLLLLPKLELRCCCGLWLKLGLLLSWCPLSLHGLAKRRCDYWLECTLVRLLLECVYYDRLNKSLLLLWLVESSLRLAKVNSLRCRGCSAVKSRLVVEIRRRSLLKIEGCLLRTLLERIVLDWLLSKQILRLIGRVSEGTWLLRLRLIEVE